MTIVNRLKFPLPKRCLVAAAAVMSGFHGLQAAEKPLAPTVQATAADPKKTEEIDQRERLYVVNVDGTNPRQVCEIPGYEFFGSPSWSPDGKLIGLDAWNGLRTDYVKCDIVIVNTDGSRVRTYGDGAMPSFSPDSKSFTYCRYGNGDTWIRTLEPESEAPVSTPLGWSPRWSPDGNYIAANGRQSRRFGLSLMNLKSKTVKPLLPEGIELAGGGGLPSSDMRDATGKFLLTVVPADGGGPVFEALKAVEIQGETYYLPASKAKEQGEGGGAQIVSGLPQYYGDVEIQVRNPNGETVTRVVRRRIPTAPGAVPGSLARAPEIAHPIEHVYWNFSFSPNGKWIAASAISRDLRKLNPNQRTSNCIIVVSTDTEQPVYMVFPIVAHTNRVTWTPDGKLFYVATANKVPTIFTFDPFGSHSSPEPFPFQPDFKFSAPAMSPDGKKLVMVVNGEIPQK